MSGTPEVGPIRKRRHYSQVERRALSDQRMMDAALKLIARQGSNRTTLAEIGEVSGYTYGLVGSRFGSKAALVRAVTRHLQARFAQRSAPEVGDRTGIEALKVLVESYLSKADSVACRALYVLIGEGLGPVPDIRSEMAQADRNFRDAIRKHIEQGIKSGEIRRDIEAAVQAALLLGTLRGVVFQRLINPGAFDLKAICEEQKDNLDKSLRKQAISK